VGVVVGDRMAHQEGLGAFLLMGALEQEVDQVVLGAALEHPKAKVCTCSVYHTQQTQKHFTLKTVLYDN